MTLLMVQVVCNGQSLFLHDSRLIDPFDLQLFQGVIVEVELFKEDGLLIFHKTEEPPLYANDFAGMTAFDGNGNILWHKVIQPPVGYGDLSYTQGSSITRTSDMGYAMIGRLQEPNGSVMLTRMNGNADSLWTVIMSSDEGSIDASGIITTADAGFAICGNITDTDQGHQGFLVRTDALGSEQWRRIFGDTALIDNVRCLTNTSDGGLLVAGTRSFSTQLKKVWLAKFDDGGDLLWEKFHSGNGANDGVNAIIPASGGGYVITGAAGEYPYNQFGRSQHWTFKVDDEGDMVWSTMMTSMTTAWNSNWSLIELDDGKLVTCGQRTFTPASGDFKGFVGCLSSTGELLWDESLFYTTTDEPDSRGMLRSMQLLPDGSIIAAGIQHPPWPPVSTSALERDVWLVHFSELDAIPLSSDHSLDRSIFQIHPNPASDQFMISLSNIEQRNDRRVRIMSLDGRKVHDHALKMDASRSIMIDLSQVASGTYMVLLDGEEGMIFRQKMIIHR